MSIKEVTVNSPLESVWGNNYPDPELPMESQEQSNLSIPDDIMFIVFSHFSPKQWCEMASVSRSWNALLSDDRLWNRLLIYFPEITRPCGSKNSIKTFYLGSKMSFLIALDHRKSVAKEDEEAHHIIRQTSRLGLDLFTVANFHAAVHEKCKHAKELVVATRNLYLRSVIVLNAGTMQLISTRTLQIGIEHFLGSEGLNRPEVQEMIKNFEQCHL